MRKFPVYYAKKTMMDAERRMGREARHSRAKIFPYVRVRVRAICILREIEGNLRGPQI